MCSKPRGKNTRRVATVNSPARRPEGGVRNSGSLAAFPATTARPNSKGGERHGKRENRLLPSPRARSPRAALILPGDLEGHPAGPFPSEPAVHKGASFTLLLFPFPALLPSQSPREAREFLRTRSVSGGDPFPTVLRGFLNSLIASIEVFPRKSSLTGLLSRVLRAPTL